ncbi:MAG: acyltransferase [Bacteroidetes bacterium]|nr:acyltransferase [Bacteroidota bacterium]
MSDAASLPKAKLSYIPSLDGIRGLFCILIIINHWSLVLPLAPIGWEVLQIFFVMSGFLITRILIYERAKHDNFKSYVKSFYLKRSLRIFPLYFIYLFFWGGIRLVMQGNEFVSLYTEELAQNWQFYFTYTANLKSFFNFKALDTPFFAHLWSLSLEEQFYLIMPFIIFFLKGRLLKTVIVILIIIPMIMRIVGYPYLMDMNDNSVWGILLIYRNLIFQTDSFALGAAIAIFNFDWIKRPHIWFWLLLGVIVGLNIYHYPMFLENAGHILGDMGHIPEGAAEAEPNIGWYITMLGHPELLTINHSYAYMMPLINIWCFFMLLASVQGKPISKWLFENKTLMNVGKVTYGMYVFHFCVIIIFLKVVSKVLGTGMLNINILLHIPLFIIYIVILYYISKFSFNYIEAPFLKLKNRLK